MNKELCARSARMNPLDIENMRLRATLTKVKQYFENEAACCDGLLDEAFDLYNEVKKVLNAK